MSSIFERPNLNKIFLVYGNLDDMFMSPDLQKSNFRPFLNSYLKSLGYQQVVFYSGAKNVGKYVLDDQSAVFAINKNKRLVAASDTAASASAAVAPVTPKVKKRILNPEAKKRPADASTPSQGRWETVSQTQNQAAVTPAQAQSVDNQPTPKPCKMIYKQPKITPAEFLDDAKKMMADGSVKTAIVFTFFQDFVSDSSAPLQQYSELLSHLWDEYSLNSNENICIFLAPQMDVKSLKQLFDSLPHGVIFKSRFFNEDGTINRISTIGIGLPNSDEFRYMLEYFRVVGEYGRRIQYRNKDLPNLISSLMYLSHAANQDENRAGYLSSVYDNIAVYMKKYPEKIVPFTERSVKDIYSKYQAPDTADPMERLKNTRGWESVARRISDIVTDFKMKKKQAMQGHSKPKRQNAICANERIDPSDTDFLFEYAVPNFVLRGNPGVGKTTIARLIGQIFYETGILEKGLTIEATSNDLVDQYVGGTTEKTKEAVMKAQEGVLFIDDAYTLVDKTDGYNPSKEAIDELVAILTNTKSYRFCLIMAGYPEQMDELLKMNAGLGSRISAPNILTIDDYPPDLLQEIFENNCRKDGYHFWGEQDGEEPDYDLKLFFQNLYGQRDRSNFGNARDAVAIARNVKMKSSLRDDEARCIVKEDFDLYQKYFEQHGITSVDEIYAEVDKYVGLDFVKELFETVRLEILDDEDCKRRGVQPDEHQDHYIFAGNPGTGKTTVGKMIGHFYHLMGVLGASETIFVDASDLIGNHVGDSQKKTLETLQNAINHNALLYIDEAYQITDSYDAAGIVGAMMTKMTENADDFRLVFGMYSDRVDAFLKLNPGLNRRLRIINFPDYTPEQLVQIFNKTIAAQGRTIDEAAHHLIELLMEYKYNTRTERFGNAGDVKKLVADMKKLQLRRTSAMPVCDEKYRYTSEDIPQDQINLIQDQINPRSFKDIMADLDEKIGLAELKAVIKKKQVEIEFARRRGISTYGINPGYYFFVGNAGTGKSTSAKLFGECLRELGIVKTNNFYSCTAKDFIGQYMGETDKKTYELLKKSINGVLFIDEAYSLSYANSYNPDSSYKKEALDEIIAFMDDPEHRNKCCIIFAGYTKDMQGLYKSNSGMRSRIEEVHFEDYTAEQTYQIFELFCHKNGYVLADGVREHYLPILEQMVCMEYFSNGRTARTMYEETFAKFRMRILQSQQLPPEEENIITPDDLLTAKECYRIVSDS